MAEPNQPTHTNIPAEGPVLSGKWDTATWEFYTSETLPLNAGRCTAVACVALRGNGLEVVLTCDGSEDTADVRRGKWEIPGGHVDLLDPNNPDSPREPLEVAARREAEEECGAQLDVLYLFGYRKIYNQSSSEPTTGKQYPKTSFMAYYWATVNRGLQVPTDDGRPASGTFTLDALEPLQRFGLIDGTELAIVRHGMAAGRRLEEEPSHD